MDINEQDKQEWFEFCLEQAHKCLEEMRQARSCKEIEERVDYHGYEALGGILAMNGESPWLVDEVWNAREQQLKSKGVRS